MQPVPSVDAAIAAGLLPPGERDQWVDRLEAIAKEYRMTITEATIVTSHFEVPYTLSDGEGLELFLLTNFNGEEATLTYTPREDGLATFRSSATRDMDHWVWRKIP